MKIYANESALDVIDKSVEANMPVLLVGETGTGKTTIIREIAKKRKKELVRVNLNGQTGIEELVGKWLIDKGKTVWQDGVMTDAMRKGQWIVFDEINAALPEVLFTLNSLLDDDRKIVMAEKSGEVLRPKKGFRFFATMNPSDEYAGTKEMNKALLSRFGAVLDVEPLDEDNERKILTEAHNLKTKDANILARISELLRAAKKKEELFFFCSTRDLINTAHLMNNGVPMDTAIVSGIVNKARSDERKQIIDIIMTVRAMKEIVTHSEKEINKAKEEAKEAEKQREQMMKDYNNILKQAKGLTDKINDYLTRTTTELSDKSTEKAKEIAQEIFGQKDCPDCGKPEPGDCEGKPKKGECKCGEGDEGEEKDGKGKLGKEKKGKGAHEDGVATKKKGKRISKKILKKTKI